MWTATAIPLSQLVLSNSGSDDYNFVVSKTSVGVTVDHFAWVEVMICVG